MMRKNIGLNYSFYVGAVLVGLLWLKCALAAETEQQPNELPPLKTLAAQMRLAGIAEPGQDALVTKVYTLPDHGPRFVRLRFEEGAEYWMEYAGPARVGQRLHLDRRAYLFTEPVAEEGAEDSGDSTQPGPDFARGRQGLIPAKLGVSSNCNRFIQTDGSFGPWGSFLMSRLNRREHGNLFVAAADTSRICPKFSAMGDEEKKNFLTWLVASMAAFESGCNEKVKARGVNGTAAGLLQLHMGKEHNYGCRRGMNSLEARANLDCGLLMLDNDVARTRKLFPSGGNYWQVLRPQSGPGRRTLKVTKAYGPCY